MSNIVITKYFDDYEYNDYSYKQLSSRAFVHFLTTDEQFQIAVTKTTVSSYRKKTHDEREFSHMCLRVMMSFPFISLFYCVFIKMITIDRF